MPTPKNLILPDPDTLNQVEYGKFLLANLAAKRAKQIKEGAPPLVRIESNHPLSIALAEIAQGKIKPLLDGEQNAIEETVEIPTLDLSDEDFLLPSLEDDEDDDDGLSLGSLVDDEDELEDDEDVLEVDEVDEDAGLGELIEDDTPEASDDLSLDDLAEKEEEGEDPGDDL
ncbi:MAG TPA: DNA-directed RNA polymerase subunit omega [Fimbriimonadaceae bacterium]|nr:DNA-directed RNA polymerase subunit omega [Fimbriimonadaceae bacterium]HRE94229.1 DNA-directed RNA polymerase subunit omega [Fimbriimonadaceae bacterium]HRI73770.1 DNA-directed RNA polymerase subunit omega [Fimbriimonadaceae bacterium]